MPVPPDREPVPFPPELRGALARREPAALARFFDAFYERVHAYLRRLVGDEHLAEDLAQDVFLQAHRALASYDPERDPRPWLFTIATNKLRDHWRARAGERGALGASAGASTGASLDAEELAERLPDVAATPEVLASEEELAIRVRAAIDALPPGLRAPLFLRVYEGLAFEDIGHILERNEVAARKRYSRALAALREALGEVWKLHAGDSR